MNDRECLRLVLDGLLKTVIKDNHKLEFSSEESSRYLVPVELENFLNLLPVVKGAQGLSINRGNGIASFSFGDALVRSFFERGVQVTVDSFLDFCEEDFNPCVEVIMLGGIEVKKTFELGGGIFIAPLMDVPSESIKKYVASFAPTVRSALPSPKIVAHYVEGTRVPKAALYRLHEVRPKFTNIHTMDESDDLGGLCELLTLVGPSSPIKRRGFWEFKEGAFLCNAMSYSFTSFPEETRVANTRLASEVELENFKMIYSNYKKLSAARRKRLEIPLGRLNESVRHTSLVNRAIDLGIALESLLLEKADGRTQLSKKISVRGAWLLGTSFAERQDIFKKLKKIYGRRSDAVHEGVTSGGEEVARKLLDDGLILCTDLIKKMVQIEESAWKAIKAKADIR